MLGQNVMCLSKVYDRAVRYANVPVLEWIYQEAKGDLPRLQQPVDYSSSPETVVWLLEHKDRMSMNQLTLDRSSTNTSFQTIKRCLEFQSKNGAFRIINAEIFIHSALKNVQLEDLQWMHEHWPAFFRPTVLGDAVRYGELDVVKWLVTAFPPHYFDNPKRTFAKNFDDLGLYRHNLDMVKWVLRDFQWRKERNRKNGCAKPGITPQGLGTGDASVRLRCLHRTLQVCRRNCSRASQTVLRGPCMMDEAAGHGHLDVVKFLHSHPGQQCSSDAMDVAAGNGHLELVQWLHENRSEGCSKGAMNEAAAAGHLAVVQWLSENRSKGYTRKAMTSAAMNGHLQVVRWLHENRREGCSKKAIDRAAAYGQLDVVRFIHTNR